MLRWDVLDGFPFSINFQRMPLVGIIGRTFATRIYRTEGIK
jgi:hypothetical protein